MLKDPLPNFSFFFPSLASLPSAFLSSYRSFATVEKNLAEDRYYGRHREIASPLLSLSLNYFPLTQRS